MENVQVSCFTHSIIIELQVDFHYFPKYRSIMCAAFLSCVLLYKVFSMISTELSSHLYNLKHSTKKDQKVCFKSTQYLFRQCWIKFFFLLLIQIHSIYKVNWTEPGVQPVLTCAWGSPWLTLQLLLLAAEQITELWVSHRGRTSGQQQRASALRCNTLLMWQISGSHRGQMRWSRRLCSITWQIQPEARLQLLEFSSRYTLQASNVELRACYR